MKLNSPRFIPVKSKDDLLLRAPGRLTQLSFYGDSAVMHSAQKFRRDFIHFAKCCQ